jgi:hypothetical protein
MPHPTEDGKVPRYYRKIIRITAQDSPNVRLALAQQAAGRKPTNETILPGVLSWDEYKKRLATWDEVRKTIGLFAQFYAGSEVLLFPPEWLNRAAEVAAGLAGQVRKAEAIGCDPGEGGANSSWSVVDRYGLIELYSVKTPDTTVIPNVTISLMQRYGVPAEKVALDRGGGGKQHADVLRARGYNVRTVAFGESVVLEPRRGITPFKDKVGNVEEKYAYKNRRAEMYGTLSLLLDPALNETGFGIPAGYVNLRKELSVFPKEYDEEGRQTLPPKSKTDPNSKRKTLTDMIGHSPDEADSLVLACWMLTQKPIRNKAGAA